MVTTVTMPVPLILVLPLLVLGALGGGDAAVVQAVVVAVDRRGHKRDREDAAVLSRPVRVCGMARQNCLTGILVCDSGL